MRWPKAGLPVLIHGPSFRTMWLLREPQAEKWVCARALVEAQDRIQISALISKGKRPFVRFAAHLPPFRRDVPALKNLFVSTRTGEFVLFTYKKRTRPEGQTASNEKEN